MRDGFIFYRSFYEASKPLNNDDKLALYEAIFEFALNQNETKREPMVNAMFMLIKPQLEANNKRYENGKNGGRPPKEKTETKPKHNQSITKTKPKEKEKEKEKDNVKGKEDNFTFFLKKKTQYGNLSLDYKVRLKRAIEDLNMTLSHDDFQEALEAKGYTYQNFLSAYKNWAKKDFNNTKPKQQYKKFEDMTLEEKMEYNEAEKQRKIEANYGR